MPVDTSIYRLLPEPFNPAQGMAQGIAMARGLQEMQANQVALQQHQRDLQAQQELAKAMQDQQVLNDDGSLNMDGLKQHMVQSGYGDKWLAMVPHFQAIDKANAEIAKLNVETQEGRDKIQTNQQNYLGALAKVVRDSGYDPQKFQEALALGIAQKRLSASQVLPLMQHMQQNPEQIQQIVDDAWRASPEQMKLENERLTAEARRTTAETGAAREVREATGTTPMSPYQQAELAISRAREAREAQMEKARLPLIGAQTREAAAGATQKEQEQKLIQGLTPGGARAGTVTVRNGDGSTTKPMTQAQADEYVRRVKAAGGSASVVK